MFLVRLGLLAFTCLLILSCTDTTKFINMDVNYYWFSDTDVEATKSAGNHVLFVVDDSSTMKTKIDQLKPSIQTLVNLLKNDPQGRYYVHMLRLSQLDVSKATQGELAIAVDQIPSGASEVQADIASWTDAGISKEYGIGALALMIRKLFPQLGDIDDVSDLAPTRIGPFSSLPSVLAPYFNFTAGYFYPKSLEAIQGADYVELSLNMQTLASYTNYYLYQYLRDQIQNTRRLNYIYPVVISDEDDEGKNELGAATDGSRIALSGVPQKFVYEYTRTFTQSSNMISNKFCKKNGMTASTVVRAYDTLYKTGPYLRNSYTCQDSAGENVFYTHYNVGASADVKACRVPGAFLCKKLGADHIPSPTRVRVPTSTMNNVWEGNIAPYTGLARCHHNAWRDPAYWNNQVAVGGQAGVNFRYVDICLPDTSTPMKWETGGNSGCTPERGFPGVDLSSCRDIECTQTIRPAMLAGRVGNKVRIIDNNVCDSSETLITASSASHLAQVPGSTFEHWENLTPEPSEGAVVKHYLVSVKGTFISDEYWDETEAPQKILEALNARAAQPNANVRTGNVFHFVNSGNTNTRIFLTENHLNATSVTMNDVPGYDSSVQTIEVNRQPAAPKGPGAPLYTNAPHLLQWIAENFPDLSVKMSSIVKHSDAACPWETGGSLNSKEGKTYRDLTRRSLLRTPGAVATFDRDLCDVASTADFDEFMVELSKTVFTNNLQSIEIQGDPNAGVFEVRDITDNKVLQEGIHYEISPEGRWGYVKIFEGAVPPGNKIRVSVFRQ